MKLSVFALAAVLSAGPVAAGAFAQSAPAHQSDEALDSQIATRIANDPNLKTDAIKVTVENGVATLSGMVATNADRARAGRLAKIPGITRVENNLKTREGATDKVKGTAGKAAGKTKDAAGKAGEKVTDGWITSRIKTKFMGDESLRASDIDVHSNDHVVTLSGSVPNEAARAKALEMARGVEGVDRVVDKLNIAK